jgi:hypothetical protein
VVDYWYFFFAREEIIQHIFSFKKYTGCDFFLDKGRSWLTAIARHAKVYSGDKGCGSQKNCSVVIYDVQPRL